MGLRKLLSSHTTEKDEKKVNRRSSSTVSLTKSISNWAHKDKTATKHQNLNIPNKRYSQPSPTISNASLHIPKKNTNPFEPNQPVTPSCSLGDVDDVVSTLQNSGSFERWSEDNYHATSKIQEEEEEEEEFVTSPITYDSNKYEVIRHNPPDATNTEDDTNEKIYAELQQVLLKLNSMDPNNAVEIKQRLYDINNMLVNTMHTSENLEGRIKQVVDKSKLIIMSTTKENQGLKQAIESHLTDSENTHTLALTNLTNLNDQKKGIESKNKVLEQDKQQLVQENAILCEAYKAIETELVQLRTDYDDLKDTRTQLYNLLLVENDQALSTQIKTMMMTIQNYKQEETQVEVANEEAEQNNAVIKGLQAEKIELEYGTAEIRDLMDKEHDRLVAQIERLATQNEEKTLELEFKLTEIKDRHKQSVETLRLENQALKQQLVDMEIASQASAKLVMRENKLLEERIQQESNGQLNEPEEIMQLHTKAQLGLIEYLEGQDDVIQAMAKFKKQLETNMSEF